MAKIERIVYAPDAFKLLNGIFCIYKPSELSFNAVKNRIIGNLCRDLNLMKVRPPENRVEIRDEPLSETGLVVVNVPSVADNPLVVGPRYQIQDFRFSTTFRDSFYTSGLCIVGFNSGKRLMKIHTAQLMRTYQLCAKLGKATTTFHEDGKIIEKSRYGHVSLHKIDRVLASIQAAHQKLMFHYMGVNLHSQLAYEIASKGLVRPSEKSPPIVYGIKCTHFESPDFTLEVQCINENEEFLLQLVNNIGLELKTNAVCSKIRRTRYGNFTLDHALLRKHWTVEHIINNILQCKELSLYENIIPSTPKLTENPFSVTVAE